MRYQLSGSYSQCIRCNLALDNSNIPTGEYELGNLTIHVQVHLTQSRSSADLSDCISENEIGKLVQDARKAKGVTFIHIIVIAISYTQRIVRLAWTLEVKTPENSPSAREWRFLSKMALSGKLESRGRPPNQVAI